jgi:hypothetical protein
MEETPSFDSALERLRAFLTDRGWPTNLVWRKNIDVARLRGGEIVVRRRSESAATRAANARYELGVRRGVGISLEVLCDLDGAACAIVRWTSEGTENEYYGIAPDRGLKLGIVTGTREDAPSASSHGGRRDKKQGC